MLKFPAKKEVADYDLVTRIMSLVIDVRLSLRNITLINLAEFHMLFTSNNPISKSATSCRY